MTEPRIVKSGTCPSVSGASTLNYDIGMEKTEIHFRITANSGGGLFGKEWIAWSKIQPVLEKDVTSGKLRPLFQGKSANTPGFLLAVLKAEGLVEHVDGFRHRKTDPTAFLAAIKKKR